MSWENVWPLPRPHYTVGEIDKAIAKALAGHRDIRLAPPDPDLAEFAADFAADEADGGSIERAVEVSADDEPESCAFRIDQIDGAWRIWYGSGDVQSDDANEALGSFVARISVLLGGPEEPDAI